MSFESRLAECTNQVNRYKFEMENNIRLINQVKDLCKEAMNNLDTVTKNLIEMYNPKLLDRDYIDSLDKLSYEEITEFMESVNSLTDNLLKIVEESLS